MSSKLDQDVAKALGWILYDYETGMSAISEEQFTEAACNDGYAWKGFDHERYREAYQWQPSQDPTLALLAFEALRAKDQRIRLTCDLVSDVDGRWSCMLTWGSVAVASGFVATFPEAVCIAILKCCAGREAIAACEIK